MKNSKQVSWGAAFVLSLGVVVAGCSKDSDTILSGGGGLLQNTDTTPFGSLTVNNLSPDGGGFTPNSSSHAAWRVEFNCDSPKSDGTFSGDESALVLFSLANNRVFASHFLAGSFTPSVELEATDRDYGAAVALNSYVLIPLNTANYQAGVATPAAEVNSVRANAGSWLIMGEFQTKFVTPGQKIDDATTLGKGVRRTLGSWVFLKSERDQSLSTATIGGTVQEFRHGFQRNADEIPTALTSGGIGTAPPNSVMSYGVATDGLAGQAVFRGRGNPFGATSTNKAFWLRGGNTDSTMQPRFEDAQYHAGEGVSVLAAVFTQVESSLASEGNSLRRNSLDAVTSPGGQAFLRYRTFNLATLGWGTEGQVSTGIRTSSGDGATEAGAGVVTELYAYNGTVFYRYMDASMLTNPTAAFTNNTLDIVSNRFMIAATRFLDSGNGACAINTIGGANAIDVSPDAFCVSTTGPGTPGAHTTSVPTPNSPAGPTNPAPSWESANFFRTTQFTPERDEYRSIYGPDEGLEEISLFFTIADGTASGAGATGSGPNSNAEFAVVGLAKGGALAASAFVAGTNPVRISGAHATDNQQNTQSSATTNLQLDDPISRSPSFVLNRTGRWIGVLFVRPSGVGENNAFGTDLFLNIYQPFRRVSSTTGGASGGTAANMEDRVLAGGPSVVNQAVSINATSSNGNRLPARTFNFQGHARYRGLQSDANVVNVFFEQSDATEDHVFGARVQVTLNGSSAAPAAPTIGALTSVELTFVDKVRGDAAFNNSNGTPGTSSFDFLNFGGSVFSPAFNSIDAGPDAGNSAATLGNALVVFRRIDDATTSDSGSKDLGDVSIYATTFNGTAFEAPVRICTAGDSNEAVFADATGNRIKIDALVPVHRNSDIVGKPNFPTQADSGYFVVLFKDREAGLIPASTATSTVVPGNASSRLVQYARRIGFANSAASPAATAIADRITPSVTNTSSAPFALPSRLDHEPGGVTDVGKTLVCSNADGVGVLFRANNQVWYQVTTDGQNWLRDSSRGVANPGLVSNFSSANVAADADFELHCCEDGEGNAGAGFLLFRKQDLGGTTRGFAASRAN